MGIVSNVYFIIFLPLFAALFCQICGKKNSSFVIALTAAVALLLLIARVFPDILAHQKIANDFELSPLSIALEFKLDIVGIVFLLLLVFLKIVILFFYRCDFDHLLDDKSGRIFYSVFLLHLFSLAGIFTTNNLLNLFLFFEIYAFSFFATTSISRDAELLKLSFRYFCLNAASSLLILFSFFAIYLICGEVNFERIAALMPTIYRENPFFILAIFVFLALGIFIKFFPFWLYFEKLKSVNPIANFLAVDSLFIKSNIGIFLILKFIYFFFGSDFLSLSLGKINLSPILLFFALCLIFYSAFKLYFQKHLKLIVVYLSLNNIGFILAAIALHSLESLQALFFYVLNFSLVNLFIFIFASFLKRHFANVTLQKIYLIREKHFLLVLPLKMLIFFIAAFPLTMLFFANWYIAYASFTLGFAAFLLLALIASNFVYVNLAIRLISAFFANEKTTESTEFNVTKYRFYLISFWFLIVVIYGLALASGFTNSVSLQFASYLIPIITKN
jgi:multicomponent Na+:H+ antiporter subunit D